MKKEFWEKWEKANCLEKQDLVETLPIFANGGVKCPFFSSNLINSYFEDLYYYMKMKGKKE